VLVGIAALAWATDARAGNTDSFYYSDDAALTAGSVVANTRDAGAIWYNPAGLGGNARGEVDFNGTALALRIRHVPRALSTRVSGDPNVESNALNSTDFFSAPHALTFIRNISAKLSVGFGLYVTEFELRNAESQTSFNGTAPSTAGAPPSTVAGTYRQRVDTQLQGTSYHAGPAIGYAISPQLRVGAALFGTYAKAAGFSQYFIDFNDNGKPPTTVASLLAQDRELLTYIGVRAQAGVQYDVKPDWHLGLLVRSPEFLITSSDDGAGLEVVGLAGPGITAKVSTALTNPQTPFKAFNIVTPMRVIASVAHDFAPKTWLAAEVDFQTGVSTTGLEQDFTVNGRVGGRYALTEKLGLGAGLFTDRSTRSSIPLNLGGDRVDYYGLTGGVELLTPLSLRGKAAADALVLSTTLALRYAIGLGSARATDIDFVGSGNTPPRVVAVTYHEIVPYIGSGVLF
jgi:hypothetical protein